MTTGRLGGLLCSQNGWASRLQLARCAVDLRSPNTGSASPSSSPYFLHSLSRRSKSSMGNACLMLQVLGAYRCLEIPQLFYFQYEIPQLLQFLARSTRGWICAYIYIYVYIELQFIYSLIVALALVIAGPCFLAILNLRVK